MSRTVKRVAGAVVALTVLLGVGAWMMLRVEDVPETLEPVGDPDTMVIPGIGDQAPLSIPALRGKTAVFVVVGVQNWGSDEGRMANRALNRWTLPPDTVGYIIFDGEGFGFLADASEKYMAEFGHEVRFEMYGDFEGAFRKVFKLAQGHHGLVVIDPAGEVVFRKSGGIQDPAEIEQLRQLVGGREPPPGPPVPDFQLGPLSDEACATRPCVIAFLGEPVARADIPGIEDGFDGEREEGWAQMRKPAVRLAATSMRLHAGDDALTAIVGETPDLSWEDWHQTDADDEVRTAFGIASDQTALLVLHAGTVAVRIEGLVQFYRLGRVSDIVGAEFDED